MLERLSRHGRPCPEVIEACDQRGARPRRRRRRNPQHFRHPSSDRQLEAELADLHGKAASLVFTSGWISNLAGISTIASLLPDCLILSDALNHNSMIEGVRRSGCDEEGLAPQRRRSSRGAARRRADRARQAGRVREPLFDGRRHRADRGDRRARREIWRDDLYRRGPCGRHVRPARRRRLASARGSMIASTSSRARSPRASAASAAISPASAAVIDAVRSYAPQFIFTSTLPPSVAASAAAAVRRSRRSNVERERHQADGEAGQARAARGRPAGAGQSVAHRAADGGRRARVPRGERAAARSPRHLHPADQLPDRRQGDRAPAHHADPAPQPRRRSPSWSRRWSTCGRRSACRFEEAKVMPLRALRRRTGALRLSGDEERGGIAAGCSGAGVRARRPSATPSPRLSRERELGRGPGRSAARGRRRPRALERARLRAGAGEGLADALKDFPMTADPRPRSPGKPRTRGENPSSPRSPASASRRRRSG